MIKAGFPYVGEPAFAYIRILCIVAGGKLITMSKIKKILMPFKEDLFTGSK